MNKKAGISRQQLEAEVYRAEKTSEDHVLVKKDMYLSMLHELKVLRFKVCRRNWKQVESQSKRLVRFADN